MSRSSVVSSLFLSRPGLGEVRGHGVVGYHLWVPPSTCKHNSALRPILGVMDGSWVRSGNVSGVHTDLLGPRTVEVRRVSWEGLAGKTETVENT